MIAKQRSEFAAKANEHKSEIEEMEAYIFKQRDRLEILTGELH